MTSSKFLSNGPMYALLAMYMPLAVLTAMVLLLQKLLPIPLPPLPLLISGGLCSLAATFYCDLTKDVNTNRNTSTIRGGLVVMGITYILSSLFRWDYIWGRRFLPGILNIAASVGTLYIWVSVISLKQFFNVRKRIEVYLESYQGDQLHKALFDDADLLQYIDREIGRTKQKYLLQLILIGILTFTCAVYKIPLSLPLYLLLIIILASWIGIFGFFGIIRWEHYCAAEGMSLSAFDRAKRMTGIGVFIALSIIAAILLASDKSLLPPSLVAGFLVWIGGLFQWLLGLIFGLFGLLFWLLGRLMTGGSEADPAPMELNPAPPLPEVVKGDPWPIWKWLKYGAIVLAAASFIWFMISPLLNRGKGSPKKLTLRQKLIRIIAEWFRGILTALASFWAFIKSGKASRQFRRPDAEAIRRAAGTILGAYSQAKKRDLRKSATLFARLIIWGGEVRNVVWKPAYAPGEYCGILAAAGSASHTLEDVDISILQQRNEEIIRCGELFEQALYSADVLSDAEQKEFKALVEEITGS